MSVTRRASVKEGQRESRPGPPPAGRPSAGRTEAGLAAAALVAGAVPLVWIATLVTRLGVNVPFWDEWAFIPDLRKSAAGRFGLADLWAQHNEHRLFFPRLVFIVLAHFTHWNQRSEMAVSVVLAAGIVIVMVALLHRTLAPAHRGLFLLASVAAAWFVFSPLQYQNWLWGWQLQWYLSDLAALSAIALLTGWPAGGRQWVGVVCAIGAAVVASYSLASGLLVWLACLVVFLARRDLRRYLPAWVLAAGVTIGAYLVGYHKPPQTPPITDVLHHPGAFTAYVLRYLGAPLFGNNGFSAYVGAAMVLAFVATALLLSRRRPQAFGVAVPWVGLGLFAVLAAVLTGVGRVGFGVGQAEASRYVTTSTLFLVAVVALILLTLEPLTSPRRGRLPLAVAVAVLGVVLVAGLIAGYREGLGGMRGTHGAMEANRVCLATAKGPSDPCLSSVVPGGGQSAWKLLQYLRRAGLGGVH